MFIACVAGVETGRGLGGREKGEKGWGETVRDPFPFSCRPYLQTPPPPLFAQTTKASLFTGLAVKRQRYAW